MALKDSFTTFDGTGVFTCKGADWYAQTFTTTSAYTITDVALNCWKYGSPGNITVSIRKTDENGKPTGGDLCSVTVADSVISTLPTLAYYTFTFVSSYALDDATKYAIVARAINGDAGNYFQALGHSGGYANGGRFLSLNSGSLWGTESTIADANFRTYGETPVPGKPTTPSPGHAGTGITLDETPLGWVSGGNTDTYEIYWRIQGDSWVLVGVAQAGLSWVIDFGTIAYGTTYEWRVDATNVHGTTTGDTWSFGSIDYDQLRISYRLISGGSGSGPYDSPPGVQGTDWEYTGLNNMITVHRLVVAANSKIWFESI